MGRVFCGLSAFVDLSLSLSAWALFWPLLALEELSGSGLGALSSESELLLLTFLSSEGFFLT